MTLNGVDVDYGHKHPIGSLIKRVQAACRVYLGEDHRWREFLSINCLRNHAVFNGIPLMNQIYVHAKLMIVDDRTCICGSANINERSQSGDRDSEVCYRITSEEDLQIMMNGKPHTAARFAHSLRRSLWAAHLGIQDTLEGQPCAWVDDQLGDPAADQNFVDLWLRTAQHNTTISDEYFLEQPANHHKSLQMYALCREIADREIEAAATQTEFDSSELVVALHQECRQHEASILKLQSRADATIAVQFLQGHLYEYPIGFLKHDLRHGKLLPSVIDAEGVIPAMTFT